MMDVVTGIIGMVLMIGFLLMIALKLNEVALWVICLLGVVLMLWGFWRDALVPVLRRSSE